jgi:hypothetical protein
VDLGGGVDLGVREKTVVLTGIEPEVVVKKVFEMSVFFK